MKFEELDRYDYALPAELIRKKGVEPRDSARLFVYDTKTDVIAHDFFYNLAKYLPENALMVLNETRVVPARLWLKKETGGKIEVFVLANEISFRHSDPVKSGEESRLTGRYSESFALAQDDVEEIPVLVDRRISVGQKLLFPNGDYFEVVRQEENKFFVRLESEKTLDVLLDLFGETPVPHYLEDETFRRAQSDKGCDKEQELRKRYQTVFAKTGASVAAPTASLHFTDRVFESLDRKRVDIAKVTLNVGQGTFAPLREENFLTKKLHREWIEVSAEVVDKLNSALGSDASKLLGRRRIVAVGTTALRTLESVVSAVVPSRDGESRDMQGDPGYFACAQDDRKYLFRSYSGSTDIFIFPPHEFRSTDILITNFHLPKTSLMLLVDAFLGHKGAKRRIISLYEEAIREKYAFYSFGDSMIIL